MAQETPPDIPYDKNLELVPGRVDEPMPGVRRVLCNNPSPFTFKGTVSYIVGRGNVAIIDPGPEDPIHSAALLDADGQLAPVHAAIHAPGLQKPPRRAVFDDSAPLQHDDAVEGIERR